MKKNSKNNKNTRKNKRTMNKTMNKCKCIKKCTNNCTNNKTMKFKNIKIKKGGKNTDINIMTYASASNPPLTDASASNPPKLLTDVSVKDVSTIEDMIRDVEDSLIILKKELTEKSFPKKYYIKKFEVKENETNSASNNFMDKLIIPIEFIGHHASKFVPNNIKTSYGKQSNVRADKAQYRTTK